MIHLVNPSLKQLFLGKNETSDLNTFGKKNINPNIIKEIMVKIFNLENCNTLNYFLGSVLLKT